VTFNASGGDVKIALIGTRALGCAA
jgi:hypothetical protein